MSANAMRFLLVLASVLTAVACIIPYLALTDGYERSMSAEPQKGRVISVEGATVTYEYNDPRAGSGWDPDGDGWIGPNATEDIPSAGRAELSPGAPLVIRRGSPELALSRPSPLLLVGVVVCLLFAVWAFLAPIRERRALAAIEGDSSKILRFMLRKTRDSRLIISALALAAGAFFGFAGVVADGTLGTKSFVFVLAAICTVAALVVGKSAWSLRNPNTAPMLLAVEQTPERIVWVYEYRVVVNGISSHNVHVCCDDGSRYELNLRQLDPDAAMAALRERLPNAVFGFSPELDARYKASPVSLRAQPA